jgi:glycosyltransferase involved in cell wall biosynthesis
MQEPLISILTPFKNTAEFLAECLDSICNQTYQNWELIIVNDHSEDDSSAIVRQYAANDHRVKLLNNEGTGIIEALRTAFDHSKGDLITRMDSDDIMTLDKLEILSSLLLNSGKGHIANGLVKYFSDKGIGDGYDRYEKWLNKLTTAGTNYSEIYKECVIPSPNFMVHREDLVKSGDFLPNTYPEDYDLTFRFYKNGLKCIPCDQLTHYWRDYSTRTSRTHEHYNNNFFLEIKINYFLELEYDNSRPLTVWGAGAKGKTIAKHLVEINVPFHWICDNPKKIGHIIYGQELLNFDYISQIDSPQSIITVANDNAQVQIRDYMNKQGMESMKDYFFFC